MSDRSIEPFPLAVGGMIAMAAALGIGRFIYTPILPPMVEALGLSKSEAGFIASANYAGYLIGSLCAALPWAKSDPRRSLLAFLSLSALSTIAMAWASSPAAFALLRLVGGVASAYVLVLSSSLVLNRLARVGAAKLFYWHFGGVGAGIALSAVLVWVLAGANYDWRAMWLWGGVLALIATAIVYRLVPPDGPAASRQAAPAEISGQDKRALWRISIAYGIVGFGYIITATFIVAIARASPAAKPLEPLFWLIVGLVCIPSVRVWSTVARRFGTARSFALACLMLGAGVIASVASASVASLVVASVLLGGTIAGISALGMAAVGDLAPQARDRWIAIATSAFSVGQIAGPLVAGYGYDMTGSFLLPSLGAAATLLVAAALTYNLDAAQPAAR